MTSLPVAIVVKKAPRRFWKSIISFLSRRMEGLNSKTLSRRATNATEERAQNFFQKSPPGKACMSAQSFWPNKNSKLPNTITGATKDENVKIKKSLLFSKRGRIE